MFGAILSTPEELAAAPRFISSSTRALVPPEYSIVESLPPVRNQGNQGACVAFAAATVIEYFAAKTHNVQIHFSPQFIYNLRGSTNEGMRTSIAINILTAKGVPYEWLYPYKTTEPITLNIYNIAADWRISSRGIVRNVNEAKSAIIEHGPLIVIFEAKNSGSHPWRGSGKGQGHATVLVGWNTLGFIMRNSWGKSWARDGYTDLPFEEWDVLLESWVLIDNSVGHPVTIPPPPPDGGGDDGGDGGSKNCIAGCIMC
jgi:hypothetical protein